MTTVPIEKNIDLENWPRRSQYNLFKDFSSPHVSITARVDVTGIMRAKQNQAIAPFNAILFCIMNAINAVPELRTRFRRSISGKQGVIEHSLVHPSVTVPIEMIALPFVKSPTILYGQNSIKTAKRLLPLVKPKSSSLKIP